MSAQDGVCEGVIPVKFDVWDGIISPHGCCSSPISPVADNPVTVTFAFPVVSAVALFTEAVIATMTFVVNVSPTALVPATPVTKALSPLVIEIVPIEVVPLTPTFVEKMLPNAVVPANPVTDTTASPS